MPLHRKHPLTLALIRGLEGLADPSRAPAMQAYMKTDQPFFGVPAVPRRESFWKVVRSFPDVSREEYERVVDELWNGKHREETFQAIEVALYFRAYRDLASWPLYERLVRTATNWDQLDAVVTTLVSPLVLENRRLERVVGKWAADPDLWVRRASLLAHLRHKDRTNTELLGRTILRLADEKEFFIRKAIGWVLREYARTDSDWVRDFVDAHGERLSVLSRREALKRLG
jgi:3-methyladenine DNA glycosylase AlkD